MRNVGYYTKLLDYSRIMIVMATVIAFTGGKKGAIFQKKTWVYRWLQEMQRFV